jgi:histone H3/H4
MPRSKHTIPKPSPVLFPDQKLVKKKPHRYRAGTRALINIRKYQRSTNSLTATAPFARQIRSILAEFSPMKNFRITKNAINNLKLMVEEYIVKLGSQVNFYMCEQGKKTITRKSLESVLLLKNLFK